MAHCIQRAPLQPLVQNQKDPTIQCQMCNCATFESYLRKHIQYNHMIHRRNIVDILYKLHYPAEIYCVQTQTANTWVSDLSLASLEHAGCFRDDPNNIYKENSIPVKNPVLCSVCGEIESEMMIACDKCDGWYHWKCVGITQDPLPNDVWFCSHCINTETEDNLPAEESLPIQSPLRDSGNQMRSPGVSSQQQTSRQNSNTQTSQQNVNVEGQKFSESQILIRERIPERNKRVERTMQREQNVENGASVEQQSTCQRYAHNSILITDIQDRKEKEDPFTEVVRRKRKKRGMRIEQEIRIENTEPIVTTEIDKEDTTPEQSFGSFNAFHESNMDDFDIDNPQDDMISDELVEIQEQKPDLFLTDSTDSEKTKLKIVNTFSIKTKNRNTKSTRLGKRKEKKIGMLKLQEIIPSARKPLKILIGGKPITPQEEATNGKDSERTISKEKNKAVIVRQITSPNIKQHKKLDYFQAGEPWKGKGKGKGRPGRPPKIENPKNDNFDQFKTNPIIQEETNTGTSGQPQQNQFTPSEGQELKVRIPRLSPKVIEEKTNETRELHSSKPQNKLKIKRLSTSTTKQGKYMIADDSKEENISKDQPPSKDSNISIPKLDKEVKEKHEKKSNNSLSDLTPFIYRIHKGKKQAMRVHLSNRNNKMRLSQETIDFAKKYYLQKPDDWDQRYVYMNNQYMQLKCFKFVGDEFISVLKNYKQENKKMIGPKSWKALQEKELDTFCQDDMKTALEILEMKKAQAFGTKKSSNTSRKFSKEAMNACMELQGDIKNDDHTAAIISHKETQPEAKDKPGRKKKGVPTKYVEEEGKEENEILDTPKEHKIKSSIKKRSRKPSLTGKAKVALTFDTNTFAENKEETRPKEHSPQRSRLNNILDTLRTKNMERIHKLHDSDSALDQPGPSFYTKPQYNIRYPSGSVVWAKMEESPWWPGMVDFCPDSEEYYWMEEDGAEPSWYHVVFFDKGEHVTRSWIRSEWIQIFEPDKTFDHPSLQDMDRSRLNVSLSMAMNCLEKTRDQRLAKFSLATLFQGSWGKSPHPNKSPFHPLISDPWEPSFDPSDPFSPIKLPKIPEDEGNSEIEKRKIAKPELGAGKDESEDGSVTPDDPTLFHCLMCEENVACTKLTISNHLTRHKVTLDDYPRIFVSHRDDKDMKMIMDWIKEDVESSVSVSGLVSPVKAETNMAQEAAALLARHAFMKSQRDMLVKAMFECDLCNMATTSRESFESHMITHGKAGSEDNVEFDEAGDFIPEKPGPVVDQIQPIKDWICTKPQYFTGYSVVIKTKERRMANLELAFSDTPPPPPPKERAAQEPVLPSPRLSTHKSTTHSEDQSKTSSSKKEITTYPSKGALKSFEQSKPSSSKKKEENASKSSDDSVLKKVEEKSQIENQKEKIQSKQQNKSSEIKDNPKGSHSVEALISNPHDKARHIQDLGHNTEIESIDANKERGEVVNLPSTREEHPKTLPDKGAIANTLKDDEKVKKEESPMKEAMDLSVKQTD